MEFTAYSFKAKEKVAVVNPTLRRTKNGSFMIKGEAGSGPACGVSQLISKATATSLIEQGWTVEE